MHEIYVKNIWCGKLKIPTKIEKQEESYLEHTQLLSSERVALLLKKKLNNISAFTFEFLSTFQKVVHFSWQFHNNDNTRRSKREKLNAILFEFMTFFCCFYFQQHSHSMYISYTSWRTRKMKIHVVSRVSENIHSTSF